MSKELINKEAARIAREAFSELDAELTERVGAISAKHGISNVTVKITMQGNMNIEGHERGFEVGLSYTL